MLPLTSSGLGPGFDGNLYGVKVSASAEFLPPVVAIRERGGGGELGVILAG